MQLWSRKHWQEMEPDRGLMIHQHAQAGSQKKRKEKHLRSQTETRYFTKEEIFT
jgi:hypothetical protein